MGGTRSLTKIGAVFAVVVFTAVAPYKSAYAQTRTVRNFGVGSFHSRPGFAADRGFPFRGRSRFDGGFGRQDFGRSRFDGGFGRQDFGTNIVVAPSVGLAAPYYGVPPTPDYGVPPASYYGLSPCYGERGTILHRQVDTPNGPVLQPVYVC
jgi:hypothetical protein